MDRFQIIRIIHDYMSRKPVLKAWIFGSFARGEEKAQSDIDFSLSPILSMVRLLCLPMEECMRI